MKKRILSMMILLSLIFIFMGCINKTETNGADFNEEIKVSKKLDTEDDNSKNKEVESKKDEIKDETKNNTIVKISSYYKEPESINNEKTIVLEGLSSGEYIELVVEGEIFDFEHIKLEWDSEKNDLIEKEILNNKDILSNQTIIIKTYMPEGIPSEKIKWKSKEGKIYSFIIQEHNFENRTLLFSSR